jgi:hypothetical protein
MFLLYGCVYLLVVSVAEQSDRSTDEMPVGRYVTAAAVGSGICALIHLVVINWWHAPLALRDQWRPLYTGFFPSLMYGLLSTLVYVNVRNAGRMARRLQDAQRRAAENGANVAMARLEAARSRVDPATLIMKLESIAAVYDRDPDEGDRQVDQLVSAMRACTHDVAGPAALEAEHESEGSDR